MKKLILLFAPIVGFLLLFTALFFQTGCGDPEPLPCDPPTNVQVIGLSPTSATIAWSASPGATVEIAVSPQSSPPGPFITSESNFTITGLLPDTLYTVTLRTKCSNTNYSAPVEITLRTPPIIIVDVIVQKPAIISDATSICTSIATDIIGSQIVIPWDSGTEEELLVITDPTLNTNVLIYKRKNMNGDFEYLSLANNRLICSQSAKNAPTSVQTTLAGAKLSGPGYIIELTHNNATMLDLNGSAIQGTEYSMYR